MDTKCLYAELPGDHFELLPPVLREFHRRGGNAAGTFDVERGATTLVTRAFMDSMGIPSAASKVDVRLSIDRSAQKETWNRWFGARLMRTRQWTSSGLLMEQLGLARMEFRITPVERGFVFECVECRAIGLCVPRILKPRVRASIIVKQDGWGVDVQIDDSQGTMVCRYGGKMRLA
ncbi:MAG: DUF4166 domain-containing protein [Pyrinomonadaceae bacterium]|nr:DUF4166 domain-containing protein [Phycisphaerales bacterium]